MKQRVVSAAIGLVILAVVLACYHTVVFTVAIILLLLLAMYELFRASHLIKCRPLFVICITFSVLVPLLQSKRLGEQLALICGAYAFLLFLVLIRYHDTLQVSQIALAFFFSLMVPFSFGTVLFLHDRYSMSVSLLYILLILGGAWFTDTGAYFFGRAFGRHKMAPRISPHKTIEGAIGGIIVNLICYCLITWLYTTVAQGAFGIAIQVNYVALCCLAPLASLAGILGDLTASVMKRQYGIKDFGSIMPGHGGVMDRFDSVLFVAPTVFVSIQYISLFYTA